MREETLFHEALAQPSAERAAFLDAACAGQPELRAAVEALLAAHAASGGLLDPNVTGAFTPPPQRPTGEHVPQDAQPGYVIAGRYTLEQKLGEGGMGEVWVAKQTEPVKRKVALKLIKAGMDSRAVIQRFEQERQALALMDHPHIAKVLDGGLTQDRRPFFVMELVNGLPLNKFCDEAKLTPQERLELFVPICQAVQHAHQKGIIHRDLKPSNILVTLIDGRPVPKVIDFGVAKAMAGKLTDDSLSTGFGAVVGTLEYMAPEQAGYSGEDIDTRADIYSLGVILYEMLTGLRPLDSQRLRQAALTEMIRIIREEEPSRPSTKLSTDEALPSLAALRQTEPRKLMAMLRGELDWVVMKCLEKQRDRRYETANGLVRDIQRYLADEPVEARPPSFGYRAGKFLRRHRVAAFLNLFIFASLVAVVTNRFLAAQEVRAERDRALEAANKERVAKEEAHARRADAERERDRAERNAKEAKEQKTLAEANAHKAREEREITLAVGDFLCKNLLAQADPETQADALLSGGVAAAVDKNVTVRELLDRAAAELSPEKIETAFPGRPKVQAELLATVGRTYLGLGETPKAVAHLQRAAALSRQHHGPEHPVTLPILNSLGLAYQELGNRAEELRLLQEVYDVRVKTLPPGDPSLVSSQFNLAASYLKVGRVTQAMRLLEQLRDVLLAERKPDDPDVLITLNGLGATYLSAGRVEEAVRLFEQVYRCRLERLGPKHPRTLNSAGNLTAAYRDAGRLPEAIRLGEQYLDVRAEVHGPDHPSTLNFLGNLGEMYKDAGNLPLAFKTLEEVIRASEQKLGASHENTLVSKAKLADVYRLMGQTAKAVQMLEELRQPFVLHLGPDNPRTLTFLSNLGVAYWTAKQLDKSVPLFEEVLRRTEARYGRDHPRTLQIMANLGVNYRDAKRRAEAVPLLEEAYRKGRALPSLSWVGYDLVEAYYQAGKGPESVRLIAELLPELRKQYPADSLAMANLFAEFGTKLLRFKQYDAAEPLLREGLSLCEKLAPAGTVPRWYVADAKSLLGGVLLGQKKYAEAGPLLRDGYAGLKQHQAELLPGNHRAFTDTLKWLIEHAEATGKPDEAAAWRNELEALEARLKQQGNKP